MRKLPKELDNPFDNMVLDTVESTVDFFYNIGFTPNGVTTLSLISGLYAVYKFANHEFYQSALLHLLSYYFDCLDGHLARKYNMISEFGDYYDHTKDWIVTGLMFYHLGKFYWNIDNNIKYIIPFIVIIIMYGVFHHMGCQEIYYGQHTTTTSIFLDSCKAKDKKEAAELLKSSRHLGCGTAILVITAFIALADTFHKA